MQLTKLAETTTTVTLGWQPVAGASGYVFYADGKRVSNTWNPAADRVKFAKGAAEYRVEAVAAKESGVWPTATVPPPPPAGKFGGSLAQPFPEITGTPQVCNSWARLLSALDSGGVIELASPIAVPAGVHNAIVKRPLSYVYGYGITGGRFLVQASNVRLRGLEISGSFYDGVKLADGVDVANVDLDGLNIHDCGDQGVLSGSGSSSNVVVRNCRVAKVGSRFPGDARYGHGIYTGGTSAKGWTIVSNEFDVQAFAVQLYPNASDCVVAGNTCVRSTTRGFATSYGPGHRFVGNVCHDGAGGFIEGDGKAQAFGNVYWAMKGGYTKGYPVPPGDGGLAQTNVVGVVPASQHGWLPATFRDGTPRVTADAGC